MFEEHPDILSVSDVEKALGIGRNKAYYLINHNYIKHIKIGNNYKIPKVWLIKYVLNTVSA